MISGFRNYPSQKWLPTLPSDFFYRNGNSGNGCRNYPTPEMVTEIAPHESLSKLLPRISQPKLYPPEIVTEIIPQKWWPKLPARNDYWNYLPEMVIEIAPEMVAEITPPKRWPALPPQKRLSKLPHRNCCRNYFHPK